MQLLPRRPPGRADRKAAAYAAEIRRLRAAGYTYEAIREALADVGVELSETALRREMRRRQPGDGVQPGLPAPSTTKPRTGTQAPLPTPASAPAPPSTAGAAGREIAAAFFEANPSNPLLRAMESK